MGFEDRVAAWIAVRILAEATPPWGLPSEALLTYVRGQAAAIVDDILANTRQDGFVFVQAKTGLHLSSRANGPLASALSQFVRQFLACRALQPDQPCVRPLEASRDRLVLAIDNESSGGVKRELRQVLERLASLHPGEPLHRCAQTKAERRAWQVARACLTRSWKEQVGHPPTDDELRALAALVHIAELDLGPARGDELKAQDLLRESVLEDGDQSAAAWSVLLKVVHLLAERQKGADRRALEQALLNEKIALRARRSVRPAIEKLRRYSKETLQLLLARTLIDRGDRKVHIDRAVRSDLVTAAESGSLLLTGEPGAGKSSVVAEAAQALMNDGRDVVFLAADRLASSSLEAELGIPDRLPRILRDWPGPKPGFLIIDALDAVRDPGTSQVLRQLMTEVATDHGRWHVIASIRTFDARSSADIRALFDGEPHPVHRDPRLGRVAHLRIPLLTADEIEQVALQWPQLASLIAGAPAELRELLRLPFNLWLLAQLVEVPGAVSSLSNIHSQIQLLDLYWEHRVGDKPERRLSRETLLVRVCETMLHARRLRAPVGLATRAGDDLALLDLQSAAVLAPWEPSPGSRPEDRVLVFPHQVLFDYTVSRLVLSGDPADLIERLRADPELVLVARSSLLMRFVELWDADPSRAPFWEVALRLLEADGVPEIGRLLGPQVAAERARALSDLEPLLTALRGPDSTRRKAAIIGLQHLVGALVVEGGPALVGPGAGPWAELFAQVVTDVEL